MNFSKFLNRLFVGGDWFVAYREKETTEYSVIPNTRNMWFADPFFVEHNSGIYCFCEGYDTKQEIGKIYCITINENNKYTYEKIIEQSYHMSYPFIFSFGETIYMIPETSENNTIELYECTSFPSKWVKVKNLVDNIKCVDTNVIDYQGKKYLVTQETNSIEGKKIVCFELVLTDEIFAYKVGEMLDTDNCYRNGGAYIVSENMFLAPFQYSKNVYGEKLVVKKVYFDGKMISDKGVCETIDSTSIKMKDFTSKGRISRIHTYNVTRNFEVIDFHTSQIDLFHVLKKYRAIRKEKKRINSQ